MNVIRSLTWALYNRLLSMIGFALGLAIAGAGVLYGGLPAAQAVLAGAAPQSVLRQAAIGAGGVAAGFYVWRLVSAVAFYRTVIGATEARIKKYSGTAQVKSELTDQFDDRFAELRSELTRTRKTVTEEAAFEELKAELEETRETVQRLEAAIEDGDVGPTTDNDDVSSYHEKIPDSTGTEQRPEANAHRRMSDSESGRSVPVPGRGSTDSEQMDDDTSGFGDRSEPHDDDGFGGGDDDSGGFGTETRTDD